MYAERFGGRSLKGMRFSVEWPVPLMKSIMESAIQEVQGAGGSTQTQADKEQELGLTNLAAVAGKSPSDVRGGALDVHLFMIAAVIGKAPQLVAETTWAHFFWQCARGVCVTALNPYLLPKLARAIYDRYRSGKELSHIEKLELLRNGLEGNDVQKKQYQICCNFLTSVHLANSRDADALNLERCVCQDKDSAFACVLDSAALLLMLNMTCDGIYISAHGACKGVTLTHASCDRSGPRQHQTVEAFLVYLARCIGIVNSQGTTDQSALEQLLGRCQSASNRWAHPTSGKILTTGSMQAKHLASLRFTVVSFAALA